MLASDVIRLKSVNPHLSCVPDRALNPAEMRSMQLASRFTETGARWRARRVGGAAAVLALPFARTNRAS